ncbi:hypothetical protein [Opitutus sp. ER46]|uniref:DUF4097 family beta strand repeat-containing protein n=1 Tax=Opitutus sp. ER46 TaxID=2161864 RepID=UPI000D30B30E|nr:hypothetical protein [Opitutus sp. ER46]PTX91760.1 hypothetical protein DB354_18035 [Opitutus sp. ER46]
MKLPSYLAIAAALSFAVLPLGAKTERTVEKTFTVTGAGTLRLNTCGGTIRVAAGPDGVVTIVAKQTARADSEAQAEKLLANVELAFDQSGNDVQATAKCGPADKTGSDTSSVSVEFIASVPAAYAANLHTSGGSIIVGDLGGNVEARTSGGSIRLGNIGAGVDVRTSGGSIEIESVRNRVLAHTSGGNVRVGFVGKLAGDCELSTSGGGIILTIDASAAFRLDAATGGGTVRGNGLSIEAETGRRDRDKLIGAVNGGGPLLKLRSSGGNIRVDAR